MIGFIIGLFIGGAVGLLTAACCAAAGKADDAAERMLREQERNADNDG